jgi:hypothetical protein
MENYLADAVKSVLSQIYKNFDKSFKDKKLKYYYTKKHISL